MKKLTLSLWKYLKTSVGSDFKQWDKYVAAAKKYKLIDYAAKIAVESMEVLAPLMLGETLPKLAEIYQDERDKIRVMPHAQASFDRLLKTRERDWELHERITYEALELFLKSSRNKHSIVWSTKERS